MECDIRPLFKPSRRNRRKDLTKSELAFSIVYEMQTVANQVKTMLCFCLDMLLVSFGDALQRYIIQRKWCALGLLDTRLEMGLPASD